MGFRKLLNFILLLALIITVFFSCSENENRRIIELCEFNRDGTFFIKLNNERPKNIYLPIKRIFIGEEVFSRYEDDEKSFKIVRRIENNKNKIIIQGKNFDYDKILKDKKIAIIIEGVRLEISAIAKYENKTIKILSEDYLWTPEYHRWKHYTNTFENEMQ